MTRRRSNRIRVATSETNNDPRQPSRFEKKTNTT